MHPVISLPAASSSEHLLALDEVSHFSKTDMGQPGAGPWTFRILPEPFLSAELERVACPKSSRKVDSLTFQPCSPYVHRNQDRLVVEEWSFPGGTWQFNSVLDGHVNHYTVDYVAQSLPKKIKESLSAALRESGSRQIPPSRVTQILRDTVVQLDNSISANLLDIFPRDLRRLGKLTDRDVQSAFQQDSTGRNRAAAARCLGGTTLVLSLTDPNERNVWVANLGDCHAVMGLRHRNGGWSGTLINQLHAGHNPREVQRIRAEHGREADCVTNGRVLGFLEPTRAMGDAWLKLPSLYTSRIFSNLDQDWISQENLRRCAARISTPPYVSNIPDVFHREMIPNRPWFLILSSDGLSSTEIYTGMDNMVRAWTQCVGHTLDARPPTVYAALSLLRAAIGGQDERKVSRNLTVEMEERWMDDISILIQRSFHH
ncbi:phosphatase 2C-like domain-containing protein [Roridomyces roridus]|uniref:Phosphatase 2C-like domain-containing protein n=1 Tax=Roridomyces roridus TaxID=1738132 RepID=A0AAD7CFI7_9AGAR|nr:phosphatase 2C-like domain-containing protein [Roridomyces roridus]